MGREARRVRQIPLAEAEAYLRKGMLNYFAAEGGLVSLTKHHLRALTPPKLDPLIADVACRTRLLRDLLLKPCDQAGVDHQIPSRAGGTSSTCSGRSEA